MVFLPYCCLQPSRFRGSPTAIKKLGSTVLFSPESLPEKPAECFLQKVCSATANWNHVIGTWNCQGNWHRSVTGVKWGYLEIIGPYHVMLFWHKTDNPHHTKLTFLLWNEKFALPTLPPIVVSGLPEQRFPGALRIKTDANLLWDVKLGAKPLSPFPSSQMPSLLRVSRSKIAIKSLWVTSASFLKLWGGQACPMASCPSDGWQSTHVPANAMHCLERNHSIEDANSYHKHWRKAQDNGRCLQGQSGWWAPQ